MNKGGFGQSVWTKPVLERDGQTAFWNHQADSYENADMTNDNRQEIVEVIERFNANPQIVRDIVVLGGAVGCRDPKLILKEMICRDNGQKCRPPDEEVNILFSDLSPDQVARAKNDILAACQECTNVNLSFTAGGINEVCGIVQPSPRVLMLGVYDARGFFHSDQLRSYPTAGFDEYFKNAAILGDHFWFDWLVRDKDGRLITKSSGLEVSVSDSEETKHKTRTRLIESYSSLSGVDFGNVVEPKDDLVAIQVVSAKKDHDGFFLSHWYSIESLNKMIDTVFPWPNFTTNFTRYPKGALFEIRPTDHAPTGAVTVLNNVIGNVLPEEQVSALESIRTILVA